MRHIVGSLGVLLTAAALGGCSPLQRAKTQAPGDVFGAMTQELSHTIAKGDAFDAMDDELAHAIGTTTMTSETFLAPMPLPGARMSLAAELEPALQTWGVCAEPAPEEQLVSEIDPKGTPGTRE